MITGVHDGFLGYLCARVDRLQPGEYLKIERHMMKEIPRYYHNGVEFTPADRVLENIIGSAYTHSYTVDERTGDVVFRRHRETGERHYTSPDRRTR